MNRPSLPRRTASLVLALVLAAGAGAGLGGCVSLPSSGSVRTSSVSDRSGSETLVDYIPAGPRRGSGRVRVVADFLQSMTATPLTTHVAREYLVPGTRESWAPARGTVVYGSQQLVSGPGGTVRLRLRDVVELDARGAWRGDPTRGRGRDYTLSLVRIAGQWRISSPPDRLLIPRSHFDQLYQQLSLYFLDPGNQVLVPEPVYVPRGQQAATLLTRALLRGPHAAADVESTFLPTGSRLDASVSVTPGGTARVALGREVEALNQTRLRLLLAQVVWTLTQLPGVDSVELTAGGLPVAAPGSQSLRVSLDDFSAFDPSLAWASSALFGVRDRRVVTLEGRREERLGGPFGSLALNPRSIAVDGLAQHVAGVSADGTRLLVADRDGVPGQAAQPGDARTVLSGTDLLRPVYDLHGELWVVDRRRDGARLSVVGDDDRSRIWSAPGITGRDTRHVLLSRDGTRLVAVVRHGGRDRLEVARVRRDAEGQVLGIGPARRLDVEGAPDRVIDVAWRAPTVLALLVTPSSGTSEALFASLDGSSTATALSADAALFRGGATGLVTSPSPGSPLLLAASDGRLYALSGRGRWTASGIDAGLHAATFVD